MESGHHGSDRDVEDLRGVGVGEVSDVDEDDHVAEVVRHLGERADHVVLGQPLEEGDYFLYNRLESTLGDENPDEERVIERLSQNAVVEALAEVPHDFRDAIVLVDIGEFSYADAAQILDIPVGTVMSRLHRGRRILKQRLAERAVAALSLIHI